MKKENKKDFQVWISENSLKKLFIFFSNLLNLLYIINKVWKSIPYLYFNIFG